MRNEPAGGTDLLRRIDRVRKNLSISDRDFRSIVAETTGYGYIDQADLQARKEVLRHLRSLA